jgi:DNA repair protein RecN (Recombination protein N)
MLTTLRISGFAIVDQVEVGFGPGLNVLTGETGAGKSILLEALHLVLGGRMSADVLREGASEAAVEAVFELPTDHPVAARLAAGGVPMPAGATEVLVRRTASRAGRGRAFVNGVLCTVSMLEASLRGLVDVTGQHEHVALLDESTHLALLDAYAGGGQAATALPRGQTAGSPGVQAPVPPTGQTADPPGMQPSALPGGQPSDPHRGRGNDSTILARYRSAHAVLAAAVRERDALLFAREERARRADYLAYQLRELEAVEPRPGEDAELERERQVLASAEKLREAARTAETLVYGGEGSAAEHLGRATRALGEAVALDARLEPALLLLRSALAEVEEAGRALASYGGASDGDPDRLRERLRERLQEIDERLEALRALARKHGGSLEAALQRADAMRAELASVEGSAERLERLEAEIAEAGRRAVRLARDLSRARAEAARTFARDVRRELEALAMGRCQVDVAFLPPENALVHAGVALGADGAERAQILLAPNPGEPARPLARIASGGELSRVLLAVKRGLARTDPVGTYVFDEVDSGIGGGVAEAVGRLLSEVSRERQVICVTHLPQVAAFADRHLKVSKRVQGKRTSASVVALESKDERKAEVARMLAGFTLTDSALDHAGALIAAARSAPPCALHGHMAIPVRSAARRAGR